MPSENVGNCPQCGERLVWVGRNPSSLMCPLCVDREIFESDETWTPLTRLGPGPLSREEMDRQLQGVVDRLIARTKPVDDALPCLHRDCRCCRSWRMEMGRRAVKDGPLNLRERLAEVIESMTRVGYQYQAEVTAGVVLCIIAGEIEAGAYDGMTEIGTWLRTEAER